MSDFDNLTTPPPAPAPEGEVPQDQRTMALLAHILGIFTGFIGSLIIWLVNKDNPEKGFVTDQAKEALNFQITLIIASFVSGILTLVLIGFLMLVAIGIANLVLCILAAMKANNGEAYRYPFALRLIK
ncbi:DUF4870 domain-containing protein [Stenotrophomonas sp. NLF4-10]|uniref:DUF4870 domain-containing protein n=1 Tax=Stenotrophomonas sp. NLF4-10 TaxID=2918754 RepID=UPI001EFB42CF|nr:DUF4870 domain-containing protein [Stenotrophomonas sp. NLF4-10]MCG8276651.1 DUF4870 domain-containing protein [Stenotrophomonas sp. NLF4-10]